MGRRAIGFVEEERRLNVAITRAQLSLVMFGHVATLSAAHSDALGALVAHAAATSALFDESAVGGPYLRGGSHLDTLSARPAPPQPQPDH